MRTPVRIALAVLLASAVALPATALAGPGGSAAKHQRKRGPHPVKGGHYFAGSHNNHWYVDVRVSKSGRTATARLFCFQWSRTRSFKIGRTGTFSGKGRVNGGVTGFTIKGRFRSRNAARAKVHAVNMTCQPKSKKVTLKLKK